MLWIWHVIFFVKITALKILKSILFQSFEMKWIWQDVKYNLINTLTFCQIQIMLRRLKDASPAMYPLACTRATSAGAPRSVGLICHFKKLIVKFSTISYWSRNNKHFSPHRIYIVFSEILGENWLCRNSHGTTTTTNPLFYRAGIRWRADFTTIDFEIYPKPPKFGQIHSLVYDRFHACELHLRAIESCSWPGISKGTFYKSWRGGRKVRRWSGCGQEMKHPSLSNDSSVYLRAFLPAALFSIFPRTICML